MLARRACDTPELQRFARVAKKHWFFGMLIPITYDYPEQRTVEDLPANKFKRKEQVVDQIQGSHLLQIEYQLHSSNTFLIVSSLRVTSTEIMTTTSMSCELAAIQYPHLVSTAQRRVLHLQSRHWHVSKIDTMNYHRVEFHVCKCLGISSLIEYASAQDFVEFDRISNVKNEIRRRFSHRM